MMVGLDGKAAALFSQYNYIQFCGHSQDLLNNVEEPLSQSWVENEKFKTECKKVIPNNDHTH